MIETAADRDSEVARANQTSAGIPADLPDKDALIREMVGAIQTWAAAGEAFDKRDAYDDNPGDDYDVQEFLRLNKVAMDLNKSAHERMKSSLTLARTTCPEAFEENQEQTQIDTK